MRLVVSASLVLLVACGLPKDTDDTLEHIQEGRLRAGAVVNPPWVAVDGNRLAGVDVHLVEAMARVLGARVSWARGTESELIEALEGGELDIVVGGLPADAAWTKEVGATRPYYTDTIILSSPGGSAGDLDGSRVSVEAGDPASVYLRKKGAVPVPVSNLESAQGPIATTPWKLATLGRSTSGIVLHETPRVMAVPPGENAWLLRLERALREWEDSIPRLLRKPKQ